jgi:uncharacterized membrane protein (DUF2068 family)
MPYESAGGRRHKTPDPEVLIALFKFIKALVLTAFGAGALSLLTANPSDQIQEWVTALHADPDNHYIQLIVSKLTSLTPQKLETISAGTFFYAAIFAVEGFGLLSRKHWAEILTVITTTALIPLELYESFSRTSVAKISLLLLNIAVVWYLSYRLLRAPRPRSGSNNL